MVSQVLTHCLLPASMSSQGSVGSGSSIKLQWQWRKNKNILIWPFKFIFLTNIKESKYAIISVIYPSIWTHLVIWFLYINQAKKEVWGRKWSLTLHINKQVFIPLASNDYQFIEYGYADDGAALLLSRKFIYTAFYMKTPHKASSTQCDSLFHLHLTMHYSVHMYREWKRKLHNDDNTNRPFWLLWYTTADYLH